MLAVLSEPIAAGGSRQAELQLLSQSNLILTGEVVAKAREWQHCCTQRQPVKSLTLHNTHVYFHWMPYWTHFCCKTHRNVTSLHATPGEATGLMLAGKLRQCCRTWMALASLMRPKAKARRSSLRLARRHCASSASC